MESSSSSPSAMAFSSQLWKYHVFLSFRGEDTRKTFVDHLYTALVQQGIYTYKDDETLPRGESIAPSLEKAIEESQIAVIIFSKNYADSSWCLDELVHIMKCKDTRDQIVMPIFYDVDPSEVRKQKRKYGEAFAKHELENQTKVKSWRKALVDASNHSGWEPQHIANGLYPVTSSVDDNLVGVEARMQDLMSTIQIGFGGKRMIGIWGVGGGGKTTLASSVYDEISSKFDGCCFLKNIREESSNKNGLEKMQAEILSGVLKQKLVQVGRVEEGRRTIKDRLHHRKVLIVLDDVDNLEHLEQLAGSHDWFGEGSRIIITTRDEHILTGHKVDVIHNISLLNNDEAMKLFCKHAPRGHNPIEDYELLSKDVVSYACGLPLALRILGRFLCDKDMNEWRSALARLKEIPDANILEKLKISFDGLTPVERELFLDIACFFRGHDYKDEKMLMILDACGFHPVIGIKVLIQKALITISNKRFSMHDLVQEMAHYIVRGGHPNNPEKHSRVWKREDVLNICAMDAMENLDKIEAINYWCLRSTRELQVFLQVIANMKKLRWIDVSFGLASTLPENFPPRELCCLIFSGLKETQIWEGYKYLPNLRTIKLDLLLNLTKTPNFDGLRNLERFMIRGCGKLIEIHPSFGHLEKLVYVVIDGCFNLQMLPPITRSKKLETLELSKCSRLFNSSRIQQSMENVEHLPEPFLPHNINHIGLRFFNRCLRKLDLSGCFLGDGDISSTGFWEFPNLQELDLHGNKFSRLNFSRIPRLKCLNVKYCFHLVELLELPSSIAVVIEDDCNSLESFGDISNCKWLWKFSLWGNNKLGPLDGDILLNTMLQGNAKDYFMSINLSNIDIWMGTSVVWIDWVKTYNMLLPHNWYNHFSGILMFAKCNNRYQRFNINIKQGVDEDFQSEFWQESNQTLESSFHDTYVGYVSFSSLRRTGYLNSTYNMISFSMGDSLLLDRAQNRFRARVVLIPKDDPMQTAAVATNCSEFWDKEVNDRKTFTLQHDSNSSIKISWFPWI
ncbi:disease resistance protein Roq1 isoform X2 [Lactuca sativa]|uniref:disease resistance protein Roq1 isoform X2 n=1 Tax=Lactuca sativa TaxID=4236 RepID=UPI0022B03304|nr:disease resistance protein Roq1 isoform X2 [Lactuca sativa]